MKTSPLNVNQRFTILINPFIFHEHNTPLIDIRCSSFVSSRTSNTRESTSGSSSTNSRKAHFISHQMYTWKQLSAQGSFFLISYLIFFCYLGFPYNPFFPFAHFLLKLFLHSSVHPEPHGESCFCVHFYDVDWEKICLEVNVMKNSCKT